MNFDEGCPICTAVLSMGVPHTASCPNGRVARAATLTKVCVNCRQWHNGDGTHICLDKTIPQLKAELLEARAQVEQYRAWHAGGRSNVEYTVAGIRVCRGEHEKHEPCTWKFYVDLMEVEELRDRYEVLLEQFNGD